VDAKCEGEASYQPDRVRRIRLPRAVSGRRFGGIRRHLKRFSGGATPGAIVLGLRGRNPGSGGRFWPIWQMLNLRYALARQIFVSQSAISLWIRLGVDLPQLFGKNSISWRMPKPHLTENGHGEQSCSLCPVFQQKNRIKVAVWFLVVFNRSVDVLSVYRTSECARSREPRFRELTQLLFLQTLDHYFLRPPGGVRSSPKYFSLL
jgi:hypothetical protein